MNGYSSYANPLYLKYSTSEQVVGVSSDGRRVYQKTYTGTMPTPTKNSGVYDSVSVLESYGSETIDVLYASGWLKYANAKGKERFRFINTTIPDNSSGKFSSTHVVNWLITEKRLELLYRTSNYTGTLSDYCVTVQYMKTSDSEGSLIPGFSFFAPPSVIFAGETEKAVGEWLDGRTVYCRRFQGNMESFVQNGVIYYSSTVFLENAGIYLIDAWGIFVMLTASGDPVMRQIFFTGSDSNSASALSISAYVQANRTENQVGFYVGRSNTNQVPKTYDITLVYVKES